MGGIINKLKPSRSSYSDVQPRNRPSSSPRQQTAARHMISPFVFKRWSSMYIDEDGDIAHEFFTEPRRTAGGSESARLQRIDSSRLTPQGYVRYDIPRLHPSIPYIMVETSCFNAE